MNESQQSSKHMTTKNQNLRNGNTDTSLSISLKRALLCSNRQERGRRSANSAFLFFSMENTASSKLPPLPLSLFSLLKVTSAFPADDPLRLLNYPAGYCNPAGVRWLIFPALEVLLTGLQLNCIDLSLTERVEHKRTLQTSTKAAKCTAITHWDVCICQHSHFCAAGFKPGRVLCYSLLWHVLQNPDNSI